MFGLSPLRLYLYAGVAAAFLLVLGFAGCEHRNANEARAERDAAELARDTAVDANDSNQVTIKTQAKALDEWRSLQVTPEEAALAIAAHQALIDKVLELAEKLAAAEEKDDAKPECVALLDTDFERACPATARELRKHQGGDQDGDGGSAGAGGQADRLAPRR